MAHAGGRPPKQISKSDFEKLCGLQCTMLEICDFFDVDDKTLTRWCKDTYSMSFSEVFNIKRGSGLISLRRNQWKLAEKNAAMAIFLGKNYLGQRDNVEIVDKTDINKNIQSIAKLLNNPKENRTEENINE